MGRRQEIQDGDILEAARHVFLSRGVHATTVEIARRANASEASVFKRFKTKSALFCAAMRPDLQIPPRLATLPERAGQAPVAPTLEEAGHAVLDVLRVVLPTTMMAWSNGQSGPLGLDGPGSQKQTLQPLVAYVKKEMALGRLRRGDPEIVARAFVGGIADYVVTETLRRGAYPTALSPQKYIRGLIDLILNGAAAARAPAARRPSPHGAKKRSKQESKKGSPS